MLLDSSPSTRFLQIFAEMVGDLVRMREQSTRDEICISRILHFLSIKKLAYYLTISSLRGKRGRKELGDLGSLLLGAFYYFLS